MTAQTLGWPNGFLRTRPLALLLSISLCACASSRVSDSDEALIRELVTIRAWDGHTGFNTPDGRRSYGWQAKEALVERGADSVPALADALRDPELDAAQRSLVLHTLAEIGPDARAAVPTLVAELNGADVDGIQRVCWTLTRIGSSAAEAVPALDRVLRERGAERMSQTRTYGDIVWHGTRLGTTIAVTLGAIGPHAERTLPVLAEGAVQTDDAQYRLACRNAIRKIIGPELHTTH